jgi:hypothetical protein
VVIFEELNAQLAFLMIQSNDIFSTIKKEMADRAIADRARVGECARITFTREIVNTNIGDFCEIQGASRINSATLLSNSESSTYIGSDVIIENTIVAEGASVVDGAKVNNSFIGEAVHVGRGFSAESSLFFANSYMDNGEACATFCGPFCTSHHKATLLIGGMFSFYNAGSATNQSNHAYKMGPIHWGLLDRGSKTASACHVIWPAKFGAFSMIMGKVENHPDTRALPFSYIFGKEGKTWVVPAVNIATVGTWRDIKKWKKRDLRPADNRKDTINYDFPNPYIVSQVMEAKDILRKIVAEQGEGKDVYSYKKCLIKGEALTRGIKLYDIAVRLFIHEIFKTNFKEQCYDTGADAWIDLAGLLAPRKEIERLIKDVKDGVLIYAREINHVLSQIHADYTGNANGYAQSIIQKIDGTIFYDEEKWRDEADNAYSEWISLVKKDAEKEFKLGDVSEPAYRKFVESIF